MECSGGHQYQNSGSMSIADELSDVAACFDKLDAQLVPLDISTLEQEGQSFARSGWLSSVFASVKSLDDFVPDFSCGKLPQNWSQLEQWCSARGMHAKNTSKDRTTWRLQLLRFLASTLQSVRLLAFRRRDRTGTESTRADSSDPTTSVSALSLNAGTSTSRDIEAATHGVEHILDRLPSGRDDMEIAGPTLALQTREACDRMEQAQELATASLMFHSNTFSSAQWALISEINNALAHEYDLRRRMLCERLDVLLESFMWSERGSEHRGELEAIAKRVKEESLWWDTATPINPNDILSIPTTCTSDVGLFSSYIAREPAHVRTSTPGQDLKAVQIPPVPDRGGRVSELLAKGPSTFNMPAFRPRQSGSGKSVPSHPSDGKSSNHSKRGRGNRGGRSGKKSTGGSSKWAGQQRQAESGPNEGKAGRVVYRS